VLSRLGDVAVAVFAADWQLIWWNRTWAALLGDPSTTPPPVRNFARDRFPVDGRPGRLASCPVIEEDPDATDVAVVSDLRRAAGRFPGDTRLTGLIEDLAAGNARFAACGPRARWGPTARTRRPSSTRRSPRSRSPATR
jgi:hypothetical protein